MTKRKTLYGSDMIINSQAYLDNYEQTFGRANAMTVEIDYQVEKAKHLIGFTIDDVLDGGEDWGLMVSKGEEKMIVWVDKDEEGNGPGALTFDKKEE